MMPRCPVPLLSVTLGSLLLAACHAHPAHPVTRTLTAEAPTLPAPPASEPDEPLPPSGEAAEAMLYRGLGDMTSPLDRLAARSSPPGTVPRLQVLSAVEQAVQRRFRGRGPMGALRTVTAFGFSGWVPVSPAQMATLLTSGAAERRALKADRFEALDYLYRTREQWRRRYRMELLRVGSGPFRFDVKITTATERWDNPDGSVFLRYDPLPSPPPETITLYRGACRLLPEDGGCRITEFLIVGTDVNVPFFAMNTMRRSSLASFQERTAYLWQIAHHQAGRPPPR